MRIHAVIDDDLFRAAANAAPDAPTKKALIELALRGLVQQHAARELAQRVRDRKFVLDDVPRRRPALTTR